MKPAAFAWQRARSVDEAIGALREAAGEAKLIAGGQSLGPMLNLRLARPSRLVDIRSVDSLRRIDARGDRVRIGASVTHARIEDEAAHIEGIVPLAHVARGIAYRAIRNRGTIGGSLAHADPAADWPLVLAALGATIEVAGVSVVRRLDAAEFMVAPYTPALQAGEILTAIEVPRLGARARWVYRKFCRKPGEFAQASAAALFDPDRRIARVFVGAACERPRSLPALAATLARSGRAALDAQGVAQALAPLVGQAAPERRQAAHVVLTRTLEEALR